MPELFYYPKINAPQSVIYQALLYWDRLVTVAPDGSLDNFLDSRMRQVHDAGLYTRLRADHWPTGRPRDLERALRMLAHLQDHVPADELVPEAGPASYVYTAKLSAEVLHELERRGLSRPVADGSFRVQVSAATQLCLISVAARDIAARHGHLGGGARLYAHTDSPAAHLFAHMPFVIEGRQPGERETDRRHLDAYARRLDQVNFPGPPALQCWEMEIGGLLPVPDSDVAVGDLIAFRERYDDERRRLMTAIDLFVHGIQRNYDHPRDVLEAMRRELESALADLEYAGRAARIRWTRRSVSVSIALAAAWAAQKQLPEAAWMLGVISGTAINVATNSARPGHEERHDGFGIVDISYLHRVHTMLR